MNKADILFNTLKPELLNLLDSSPDYGSVSIKVTLQDNKPVKIESSKSVTLKISKEGK